MAASLCAAFNAAQLGYAARLIVNHVKSSFDFDDLPHICRQNEGYFSQYIFRMTAAGYTGYNLLAADAYVLI